MNTLKLELTQLECFLVISSMIEFEKIISNTKHPSTSETIQQIKLLHIKIRTEIIEQKLLDEKKYPFKFK